MGEIMQMKVVKAHSADELTDEIMALVARWQVTREWRIETQFQPLMQPNGKPLYTALVVARDE